MNKIRDQINKELAEKAENNFAKEVYLHDMNTLEILNWYRNLYYKEDNRSEQGIMADAINDLFMHYSIELKE